MSRIEAVFRAMHKEMADFCYSEEVPRVEISSPLEFYRDHVAANRPCIITNYADAWPAMQKWSLKYLESRLGDVPVTINVTPDGRGDSINEQGQFVMPEERQMTFREFVDLTQRGPAMQECAYLSFQNDNLRKEAPELVEDLRLGSDDPWTSEVFGEPDAVNLWVGDETNVSSCHNDFYENLYTVIEGTKVFTLLPPTAMVCLFLFRIMLG